MKVPFRQELEDPRAQQWLQLRNKVREYIAARGATIQQFIESVWRGEDRDYWWLRRAITYNHDIEARRIVRGESRYITMRDVFAAAINADPEITLRPMCARDVLLDTNISSLNEIFPLYGATIEYHTSDANMWETKHVIDITEYWVGAAEGTDSAVIATIYVMLVEDCGERRSAFIAKLADICTKELVARGFCGVLKIKDERGWMWC